MGDYSGQITLLKLEQNSCSVITTLKGHEGRLRSTFPLGQASRFSSVGLESGSVLAIFQFEFRVLGLERKLGSGVRSIHTPEILSKLFTWMLCIAYLVYWLVDWFLRRVSC